MEFSLLSDLFEWWSTNSIWGSQAHSIWWWAGQAQEYFYWLVRIYDWQIFIFSQHCNLFYECLVAAPAMACPIRNILVLLTSITQGHSLRQDALSADSPMRSWLQRYFQTQDNLSNLFSNTKSMERFLDALYSFFSEVEGNHSLKTIRLLSWAFTCTFHEDYIIFSSSSEFPWKQRFRFNIFSFVFSPRPQYNVF